MHDYNEYFDEEESFEYKMVQDKSCKDKCCSDDSDINNKFLILLENSRQLECTTCKQNTMEQRHIYICRRCGLEVYCSKKCYEWHVCQKTKPFYIQLYWITEKYEKRNECLRDLRKHYYDSDIKYLHTLSFKNNLKQRQHALKRVEFYQELIKRMQ